MATVIRRRVQLVTFDADDTLWDFPAMQQRGMAAASATLQRWLGPQAAHMTPEWLTETYCARRPDVIDPTQIRWLEVRRRVFAELLAEAGLPDYEARSHELAAIYYRARNTAIPLLPGAREVLAALQGRYRLGWVTNGNETPDLVGLDHYFDVIITPDRLGAAKPDPAVFAHAAEAVGCAPEAILHVGDSLTSDVAGARAAGCVAVWYNPAGRPNETEHRPDAEIRHLTEVVTLLAG
ncbi:MAG: HAD family hydrolase [Anaerolineae bacterium]